MSQGLILEPFSSYKYPSSKREKSILKIRIELEKIYNLLKKKSRSGQFDDFARLCADAEKFLERQMSTKILFLELNLFPVFSSEY